MAFEKVLKFYNQTDSQGVSNLDKIRKNQKVMRRTVETPKDKSYEIVEGTIYDGYPSGMVVVNGKLIGFGINIYNEDVYPLQYFEIYNRNCDLSGTLDVSDCEDMVFLDVYSNKIQEIKTGSMPSMRIFGVQGNCLETLDVCKMPECQGIDAGKNRLEEIDVSNNAKLVELYINDNMISTVDLKSNPELKYLYCHNNKIEKLNTRANPKLRHLNATGNPLQEIKCIAPQSEGLMPLELYAKEGGYVGLKFNPIYNAQWKETGEWEQCYYSYPKEGYLFSGWTDENGQTVSTEDCITDEYGASKILFANFVSK